MAPSDPPAGQLESRVRQQEVVAELGQQGLECDDLDRLLSDAAVAVRDALAADYCAVLELCSDGTTLRLRQGVGWRDGAVGSATVPADRNLPAGRALAAEPIVVDDLRNEERFSGPELLCEHGVTSGISVVVGSVDDPWGVLGVHTADRRVFADHDVRFVESVANVLASTIDNERTKRELREETALKDRIVEASPIGIIVADDDGTMTVANGRAEEITGRDREELARMSHGDDEWDLVDSEGDPLPADAVPFNRVRETGAPVFDAELGIRRPDGERVWILENAMPIVESDDLTGVVSEFEDVTAERRYRTERRRLAAELEATFDRISDAFFGLDTNWEFTYVNDRAAELIDPDGSGLVGKTLWEVFPATVDSTFEREYRRAMDCQEPTSFEAYFAPLETWFEVNAYPSETGLSVYFRDVTDRKETERELRATNRTLERLYEITADRERSFDEKVDRLLDLGRDRLGVDIGFLATIDASADRFEVTHASAATDGFESGIESELSKTYCQVTIQSPGVLGFVDSPIESGIDDAAYEAWNIECYLGGRVDVDGDLHGTLCFVDESPRSTPFTPAERSFVELATQWVSYELERQRYQDDLERYGEYTDDVIDAIDDVFYILDANGDLQRWNETASDVSGYSKAEIESMHALEFFAPEDRDAIASAIEEAFESGTTRVEATVLTSDGESIPYEFVASTLEDPSGNPVLTAIGRDITERRATQRRLERLVADLEESNGRLEQFAYAASHDLQEPLRMVASYLTLVERRYADELDEDGEEFIAFAVDGADRMQEMIDGLLAYSRVDTQGDPFRPVETAAIVEDVLIDLEVRIEETGAEVDVDWDALPRVFGDEGQLRQLFQNLLDNAITYAGDEAPRISVSAEKSATERIVSVRDQGIGIDPDDTDDIFRVFNRLHSADEYAGTGIGLALCQRIVERHEGALEVDSEPGDGSTFSVILPHPNTGASNQ
ncbi:PAS domain S-box protein [Halosolutus gelatinilyticus]|uniref:PAS domain S-box protein n=1 Tax=Halosolutus gelatinilyticus TaxID=2931975 RepID=UPI001FF3DE26|nr:PAS domain S-box protein [Halosolutus gelatinilyticus]